MDTFVDSSWYFIRFVDPQNKEAIAGTEQIKAWLPVDTYVGGGHVVQHLLFSRFFWKVLYDAGLIDKSLGEEPFLRLRAPGWILGPDYRRMSKRWNNVITPDDIIPKFGADVLRLYEMFMGPFEIVKPWSITGVEGINRFLHRVWTLFYSPMVDEVDKKVDIKMHQTIKKVTLDIQNFRFNTAIASMMEYVNVLQTNGASHNNLRVLAKLIAPFAPHFAEEVWHDVFGEDSFINKSAWPSYDEVLTQGREAIIVVQINNRVRDQLKLSFEDANNETKVKEALNASKKAQSWLEGKRIVKEIFIKGKILSILTE